MTNRNKKLRDALIKQLCRELDKHTDIFFAQRPFLAEFTLEPVILDRSDDEIIAKVDNDTAIEQISTKLFEVIENG